ncbi:hypothetical protein LTR85_003317 [Meristemomyces frigidus]|nr:hypothetical protein LTR85_003317 [Meristemomyces frigidus]
MPEIGEVARVVHYLRKHLVGRTIASCTATADDIVYGKVGTTAEAFQNALTGRTVTGADQQGKYFYMTLDRPPHAVMHFGMTGWMKFDSEDTHYYKQAKAKDGKEVEEEWPPKYAKFVVRCEEGSVGGEEREAVEAAFVDARRLARIRLVDCPEAEIRQHSPLKENGPDPVRDKDVVTVEWLSQLLGRKRVPVKALLLDQANLSGVGNWVADEVLYQARIHPEQYSNTFNTSQIKDLHDALIGVCTLAVETLADSKQFPDTWLMKYRWDKGKKDANVLPNGDKIVHLKVGGRTSAIVPSVQKKTAEVAGDVDEEGGEAKPAKGRKRKSKAAEDDEADEEEVDAKPPAAKKGRGSKKVKAEPEEEEIDQKPTAKQGRGSKKAKAEPEEEKEDAKPAAEKKSSGRGKKQAAAANGVKDGDVEVQTNGGAEAAEDNVTELDEDASKPANKASKGKKAATTTTTTKKGAAKPAAAAATSNGARRSARTRV